MQFQYTLTYPEFAEGIVTDRRKPPAVTRNRWIIWIVSSIAGVGIGFLLDAPLFHQDGTASAPALPAQNIWPALATSLAMAGVLLLLAPCQHLQKWLTARRSIATGTSPAEHASSVILSLLPQVPLLLLILPNVPRLAFNWSPTPQRVESVQLWPYIIVIWILACLGPILRKSTRAFAYATQRSHRQPIQLKVDLNEVIFQNVNSSHQYSWSAFDRYDEGKSVIQLITEDETIIILPKRAVPDPQSMMMLRSIIQSKIARGHFLPADSRFAVMPRHLKPIEATSPQS